MVQIPNGDDGPPARMETNLVGVEITLPKVYSEINSNIKTELDDSVKFQSFGLRVAGCGLWVAG